MAERGDVLQLQRRLGFGTDPDPERVIVVQATSLCSALPTLVVVPLCYRSAAGAESFPICIGRRHETAGAPSLTFTLIAATAGSFFQLTGAARFADANESPGSVVVYGVTGTALRIVDGFFVSLTGVGLDLAQNAFNGTFAIQLSADPALNTLTYAKRSVDGTSNTVLSGTAEFVTCPPDV